MSLSLFGGRRPEFLARRAVMVLACASTWIGGAACSSGEPATRSAEAPLIDVEAERELARAPSGPRMLSRSEVQTAIDRGLGHFLQHVRVEPAFLEGRFLGFRVVQLVPEEAWRGVDLGPGDVVTRINGHIIERPEQAHDAFRSLATANQVVVSYVREGETRELRVPILDDATAP